MAPAASTNQREHRSLERQVGAPWHRTVSLVREHYADGHSRQEQVMGRIVASA
jgi:hypothetical protein